MALSYTLRKRPRRCTGGIHVSSCRRLTSGTKDRPHSLPPFSQETLPANFWKSPANKRKYINFLARCLGSAEDPPDYSVLYNASFADVVHTGGSGLLAYYDRKFQLAIMAETPEHHWKPWKFKNSMNDWWPELAKLFAKHDVRAEATLREYIEDLAQSIGVKSLDDWERISPYSLGTSIQRRLSYFGKLHNILIRLYPDRKWAFKGQQVDSPIAMEVWTNDKERENAKEFWFHAHNRRMYLEFLKQQTTQKSYEIMETFTSDLIRQTGGSNSLRLFGGSAAMMVMVDFPEHAWRPWKFKPVPSSWWMMVSTYFLQSSPIAEATIRDFISELADSLNIKTLDDWTEYLTRNEKTNQYALLKLGSLENVLQKLYPEHPWPTQTSNKDKVVLQWTVSPRSKGRNYWTSPQNRRACLDQIRSQLGGAFESLYNISSSLLHQLGAISITHAFGKSAAGVVMCEYPEHAWQPWRFSQVRGLWANVSAAFSAHDIVAMTSIREYVEYIRAKYGEDVLTDITKFQMLTTGEQLHFLVLGGREHVLAVLESTNQPTDGARQFSKHKLPWSYWNSKANRKAYLDFLKEQLGGKYEDLYKLTKHMVYRTGGSVLLKRFNYSVSRMVYSIYPQHRWQPWRFGKTPTQWWAGLRAGIAARDSEALKELREFMIEFGNRHGVTEMEDWYNLRQHNITPLLRYRLHKYAQLSKLLPLVFPEHPWDRKRLGKGSTMASQKSMVKQVHSLIPLDQVKQPSQVDTKTTSMD